MKKFILGFLCGTLGVVTSIFVISEQRTDKWVESRAKHRAETEQYVNGWITDDRGVE